VLTFAGSADAQTAARTVTVTVTERVRLGVSPERAWGVIENFLAWPSWHPAFTGTRLVKGDGHSKGTVRLITTRDGKQFTEELLLHDAGTHSLQYRILASPTPIVDCRSTLVVNPDREGSTVVWNAEFQVQAGASDDEVKKLISNMYRIGLDNLATAFD
jgi:hypothetical protein